MRFFLLYFLFINLAFGIESVLITGFDPFDGAAENNSRIIGRKVIHELSLKNKNIEFKFCEIRTVYHKATEMILDCANSMDKFPDLIISVGESGCREPKLETRARNYLKDYSSDNDGVHYSGQIINTNLNKYFASTLDWTQAYCDLPLGAKTRLSLSNDAGTFVCNETLFNFSTKYPEINFGFIHVPAYTCDNNSKSRTFQIKEVIKALVENKIRQVSPQKYNYPTSKRSIKKLLRGELSKCHREFFTKLKKAY